MEGSNRDMNMSPYDRNNGYSLTGKIMLSAIIVLFAVVVFMICLHLYARWYLLRPRRRHHLRRHNHRRTQLVFYVEPDTPSATASRGLDAVVLNSLPVFVYSAASVPSLECAVCLSEFEENEKGRLLPKCNHSFHIDCIDMWFHSHSTCPLCRSPVEPVPDNRSRVEPAGFEPGSSSGMCATCQHEGASSSSLGDRRKAAVTIDVPRRSELGSELGPSSPASQGFKSPACRLLSLKRILSLNRKGVAVSPSSGIGTSFGSPTSELDIECGGRDESTQHQTRIRTPR